MCKTSKTETAFREEAVAVEKNSRPHAARMGKGMRHAGLPRTGKETKKAGYFGFTMQLRWTKHALLYDQSKQEGEGI